MLCGPLGIGHIIQRLPEAYLRALFAARLAARYAYEHGLEANEIDFFNFLQRFMTCSVRGVGPRGRGGRRPGRMPAQ